jgi:hypothetical protein
MTVCCEKGGLWYSGCQKGDAKMDLNLLAVVIAIVGTGMAIVGVVIGMIYWTRTESNDLRNQAREDRKDILMLVRAIETEMRDFHYRLIEVEKSRART